MLNKRILLSSKVLLLLLLHAVRYGGDIIKEGLLAADVRSHGGNNRRRHIQLPIPLARSWVSPIPMTVRYFSIDSLLTIPICNTGFLAH